MPRRGLVVVAILILGGTGRACGQPVVADKITATGTISVNTWLNPSVVVTTYGDGGGVVPPIPLPSGHDYLFLSSTTSITRTSPASFPPAGPDYTVVPEAAALVKKWYLRSN